MNLITRLKIFYYKYRGKRIKKLLLELVKLIDAYPFEIFPIVKDEKGDIYILNYELGNKE